MMTTFTMRVGLEYEGYVMKAFVVTVTVTVTLLSRPKTC